MKKFLLLICILLAALFATAQSGSITVTSVQQRSDGSGLVDVFYNLSGPATSYYMNLRVSFDAGVTYYPVSATSMSGDVGPLVPGNNRHIIWNPGIDYPNRYSAQTKLMVFTYNIESLNPCPGAPTVSDYDGNVYNTILFGSQCWMKENLKTIRTSAGVNITRTCYNNNPENCEFYGGLYDWYTMMNGAGSSYSNPSGVQGICPTGWHIPSDSEWTELTDYLINTYADIIESNIGNSLKSCRQVNSPWNSDCNTSDHPRWNENSDFYGTNDFDFSSLPGGQYHGDFSYALGEGANWWTTTNSTSGYYSIFWTRYIGFNSGSLLQLQSAPSFSYSIRCIRD